MASNVHVGIIGWNYPEWRGLVYPQDAAPASFLQHYAERFAIVEVAASHYKLPTLDEAKEWASKTPDDFRFSFKIPDWILKKAGGDLDSTLQLLLDRIKPLRDANKVFGLVAQFAPHYRRDKKADALRDFVAALPQGQPWAVELRHESWWSDEAYRMLENAGVALAWSSVESGKTPPVVTSDRIYARLFHDHSLEGPYDHKQRDAKEELEEWAERVRAVATDVQRVDILVSKYLEGYAPGTVATLCEILGIDVPKVGRARPNVNQTTLPGF